MKGAEVVYTELFHVYEAFKQPFVRFLQVLQHFCNFCSAIKKRKVP